MQLPRVGAAIARTKGGTPKRISIPSPNSGKTKERVHIRHQPIVFLCVKNLTPHLWVVNSAYHEAEWRGTVTAGDIRAATGGVATEIGRAGSVGLCGDAIGSGQAHAGAAA